MVNAIKDNSKKRTWQIFDRIAGRYDLLNKILSGGVDRYWRKKIVRYLPHKKDLQLLDLATGTGDVIFTLLQNTSGVFKSLVGMDLSEKMMDIGQEKAQKYYLNNLVTFKKGDATAIPLTNERMDVVTMAFGIRNVADVPKTLSEIYRILKSKGRVIILEFSLPNNMLIKQLYLAYFRHVLPRIGGLLSGDKQAYHYLNQSVETFPYGRDFCQLLETAKFENVTAYSLSGGIATLYVGDKA